MSKGDVTGYLPKLKLFMDTLTSIGDGLSDIELVRIALNGFTKVWGVIV